MLVGWGGNNGSTVTGTVIANQLGLTWRTKEGTSQFTHFYAFLNGVFSSMYKLIMSSFSGLQTSNYFGSICQASTVTIGSDSDGCDVNIPLRDLLPMVQPNDIVFNGEWTEMITCLSHIINYTCTLSHIILFRLLQDGTYRP